MEPDEDPRYLPPLKEFVPDALNPAEVAEDLQFHEEVVGMFASKGWAHVAKVLNDVRFSHITRLTKFGGQDNLDVIYGMRAGLAVIEEIFGMEENSVAAVERDKALLYKLREGTQA
jgi:hypothetical protein